MDSLAYELVLEIVEHTSHSDLKALSLVQNRFRVPTQTRLFHMVDLFQSTLLGLVVSDGEDLRPYVRHLTICIIYNNPYRPRYEQLVSLFPFLPNVERMVIKGDKAWAVEAPRAFRAAIFSFIASPTLTHVAFACPRIPTALLFHAIKVCKAVAVESLDARYENVLRP
ncbi:hypothetical protein C8R44DRAFT_991928 [Mycena epipterygia]|nr:hypothetical protein C8R44DRAFT_991928 [Mycena epipterygia]